MDLMSREFLYDLKTAASIKSDEVMNEHWKDAYLQLSNAADRLDAMIARSMVKLHDDGGGA